MTPESLQELQQLLSRIEAAGGPVRRTSRAPAAFEVLPRTEFFEKYVHANRMNATGSALLIHCLKLDIRARGCLDTPQWLNPWMHQVTILDRATSEAVHAKHAVEVIAYCLAWLAAFGSSPAATESDQTVSNGSAE